MRRRMRGQGGAWSLVCGLWVPGDPQFESSLPVARGALPRATDEFPSFSWERNMEFESNKLEDGLEYPVTSRDSKRNENNDHSAKGHYRELTEAELCETYGYELAMSPAETAMPDSSEDPPWVSEDSNEAPNEEDEFDLLEPFLLDSGRPSKRTGKVLELTWFSEDSNDSQTSIVKTYAEEFDKLETSLFSSEHPTEPLEVDTENAKNQPLCDEGQTCDSPNGPLDHYYYDGNIYWNLYPTCNQREPSSETANSATAESSSSSEPSLAAQRENCITETTKLVQALVKRMTLSQKMRFYAWFNSGLSIKEAALKSKTPDLIPPPVRHPNCKLSKKRLKRLSMILPTVYLQRRFVYDTYFAGVEPRLIMKYLLTDLDSENLMDTFQRQFALEELAMKEKQRRNAPVEQLSHPTSENWSAHGQPSEPHFDVPPEEPNSEVSSRRTSSLTLKGNELKKYYFWRKKGLSIGDAISKAKIPELNQEIVHHPNCEHSWEKLLKLSKALPNKKLREKFLVEVYFEGKDPGEVLKVVLAGANDYHLSESNVAENGSAADRNLSPENAQYVDVETSGDATKFKFANPSALSVRASCMEADETSVDADAFPMEKSFTRSGGDYPQRSKHRASRQKCSASENDTKHVQEKAGSKKHCYNLINSITDPKPGAGPREIPSNDDDSEISQMSLNQLKKYYKWCNLGFNHGEAVAKAQTPGLVPEPVSHPGCKHSWEEIKVISDSISEKFERLKFQIEVFYGGKNPEDVMKQISSDGQELSPLEANHAYSAASYDDDRNISSKSNSSYSEPNLVIDSVTPELSGRAKSNQMNSVHHSVVCQTQQLPQDEDPTVLSKIGTIQLRRYYMWRNQGMSFTEALSKARIPGNRIRGTHCPHPDCKHSWTELREIALACPTKSTQDIFLVETFYGGRDPHELLQHMKTDTSESQNAAEPSIRTGSAVLNSIDSDKNFKSSSLQNGQGIDSTVSEIMDSSQSVNENTASEKIEDSAMNNQGNPVLELCNNGLKKYYGWLNKGLSHDEALSKVRSRNTHFATGKEWNAFYAVHPKCKYSRNKLKEMSLVLPEKWNRDRFIIHTFYGGMDPEHAVKLLKSCTPKIYLPSEIGLSGSNRKLRKLKIQYLTGQGMSREEALSLLQNPPKKLMEELEDVIQVNCGKKRMPDGLHIDESMKIPLGSPYHPSKLLSSSQLIDYYLFISSGLTRGQAFLKVVNAYSAPQSVSKLHCQKSKYDLEEMKKLSKNLPDEVLAKTFVIETFYGQNDPEQVMKVLSSAANSMNPSGSEQHEVCRDSTTNPRFPCNEVQAANSLGPAEAPPAVAVSSFHQAEVPFAMPPSCFQRVEVPVMAPVFSAGGLNYSDAMLIQTNEGKIYPYGPNNAVTVSPMVCSSSQLQAGPSMACPGYLGVVCPPIEQLQHYTNNVVDPSKTSFSLEPPHAKRIISEEEPPKAENHTSEGNEVQCFIVPANFPKEILTDPQMDAIERNILEAILEMDDGDTKPSFKDSFRKNGRYGITCSDEFSVDWVYKYLRTYQPWEGACLQLIANQATKVRANAVLPLCTDDDEKILKFIEKQNFGLNVGKWTVVHRWDSSDGNTLMDLIIDEESAEIIRDCSQISFKLGSAQIITAKNDSPPSLFDRSSSGRMDSNGHDPSASPPPLPPSPPPQTPPPPTPPPPPAKPCIIDTSLGALLKISASKSSDDERSQKILEPLTKTGRGPCSPERIFSKRRSRKDRYWRERERSRSLSVESCGRSVQRNSSPDRIHKRRRSTKDCKRSATRSSSRDRTSRKKCRRHSKKFKKRHASRSPSFERSGTRDYRKNHSWVDWVYPGDKERSLDKFSRNLKSPPRTATPCSFISSPDDLSLLDDGANTAIENMEYAEYLGNSTDPKPPTPDVIVLSDST